MDPKDLELSLDQYNLQLSQINEALKITPRGEEFESLSSLKVDIQQLIDLTTESLLAVKAQLDSTSEGDLKANAQNGFSAKNEDTDPLDDEYALFMSEMAKSGAYSDEKGEALDAETKVENKDGKSEEPVDTNIEEELNSLEGMKCSTLYSHKWGGAPSLHNAMVCATLGQEEDNTNFYEIKVRVLFTNPTHLEMVPCPYYLEGECKFPDDQCRFSHGEVVHLSSLSEAVEPNFSLLRPGCRVLAKLSPSDEASSSKSLDKFLLWHRAVVKSVDSSTQTCQVRLEHDSGLKSSQTHHTVEFSQLFPLTDGCEDSDSDSESSLSDTPLQEEAVAGPSRGLGATVEASLLRDPGAVKLGDWEKHTRGIGSKLMEQMGYVAGSGLGPAGEGRLQPVPCRASLPGRSLDHCMALREHAGAGDPLKVEKKLKRLQMKQEERERKAYERAKEKERHNVFNVLNDVFSSTQNGHTSTDGDIPPSKKMKADKLTDVKSSSCKNLNIEQFTISEDIKRLDRDILKLKGSLGRNSQGGSLHKSLTLQLACKSREVEELKMRQKNVTEEQSVRKDKKKMTVF